jgi:RNA recognition motif-containing protein
MSTDKLKEKNKFMTKMMVKNLSSRTTAESLNRVFSEFGVVRSVRLATDIMTGRCGGFGFVHLDEQQSGEAICKLNRSYIGDRLLHVTIEQKEITGFLQSSVVKIPINHPADKGASSGRRSY